MLNIFDNDAFSVVSLTESINILPYVPGRIGEMGLFDEQGVSTTSVAIEYVNGQLHLLPTVPRGGPASTRQRGKSKIREFRIPHIPHETSVAADDVQGKRSFGVSDDGDGALETVTARVNDELAAMRQDHELTWEFHRIGAIKGVVLDADGVSEIYDIFNEFGIAQTVIDFDFSQDAPYLIQKVRALYRAMQGALKGTPFNGIGAICGDQFFDNLVDSAEMRAAWEPVDNNEYARTVRGVEGAMTAEIGGITFENYRGSIGDIEFIEPDACHFFPLGAPRIFKRYNAPADFVEAVNTIGKPLYAKQERQKFDRGIDIHTQSNPLHVCTRPNALIKGIDTTPGGSTS